MRCGAFHRVEGTLCLVRHGQAALSGSKTKAPGFAGGYLLKHTTITPPHRDECAAFATRGGGVVRWLNAAGSSQRGAPLRPFPAPPAVQGQDPQHGRAELARTVNACC